MTLPALLNRPPDPWSTLIGRLKLSKSAMRLLIGLICFYTDKNPPRLPSIHFNNDQSEKQIQPMSSNLVSLDKKRSTSELWKKEGKKERSGILEPGCKLLSSHVHTALQEELEPLIASLDGDGCGISKDNIVQDL
ncbi:hypothetical protein L6452_27178 [Arctium lappa]|uniref:Uncharacterized protein n=1 Tax=Arctium lappa TaxID=4217 RepID=A0ACB8ZW90_ARCLA|nr:hypothetical protein L6452_27178 [Arctium lappa]